MKFVPAKLSRAVAHQILTTKKNSPHIFFAGGVIGVTASTVMACQATLKLESVIDDIQADVDAAKTEGSEAVNISLISFNAAKKIGRLYGPSILVGVVSIGALTGSHVQLTRRNAALTATLAAVTKAYEEYRLRVAEELGKEKELELHRAVTEEKNAEGKKVKVVNPLGLSPYAALFDETTTTCWEPSAELNRFFIECQERMANHRLNTKGYVLLNDVLHDLGLERTTAGAVVGWVLTKDGETRGDGYIDFGLLEARNKDFVDGHEPSIWLDFNVDGVVYDLIDKI